MSIINVKNLHVSYEKGSEGLAPVIHIDELEVLKGDIVGIFGPNHVGKSTLLKAIGQIHSDLVLSGKPILEYNGIPFNKTTNTPLILHVPQDFSSTIYPWFSIKENLRILMKSLSLSSDEIEENVRSFYEEFSSSDEDKLLGDYGFANDGEIKKTSELSGGQKQILTVLRAVMSSPDIIMMDEPFAAIDIYKGSKFREQVFNFLRKKKITTFIIAHSLEELCSLTDKIFFFGHDASGKTLKGIEGCPESNVEHETYISKWKEEYGLN